MTYIALTIVIVWAVFVGMFVHDHAVLIAGKIATRPTVIQSVLSVPFMIGWGVPTAIFLAIFGGIFWW